MHEQIKRHSQEMKEKIYWQVTTSFSFTVSVWEVLPKDKKAKEEKTHLIGIGNVELIPLLQGRVNRVHVMCVLWSMYVYNIEVSTGPVRKSHTLMWN